MNKRRVKKAVKKIMEGKTASDKEYAGIKKGFNQILRSLEKKYGPFDGDADGQD